MLPGEPEQGLAGGLDGLWPRRLKRATFAGVNGIAAEPSWVTTRPSAFSPTRPRNTPVEHGGLEDRDGQDVGGQGQRVDAQPEAADPQGARVPGGRQLAVERPAPVVEPPGAGGVLLRTRPAVPR